MNIDLPTDDGWRALAGVGAGYAVATGLIFALFFLLPYLVVRSL
ncbi:hypothetical protein C461_13981 [Halorubrum aidingense JCM 13560]|uniref:Binding-protein-dependent transporters inner membrane component n=1 Tax=Halorubrum aidingense JCM 13560 TaxID=1230454 RepID=M0PAF3_9EURY|nr:hypothetical protein [Halorubrum aidingense]EMA65815.1 hypothetical protein C461_13981 [Halorubrum aidingense JCM 13560]